MALVAYDNSDSSDYEEDENDNTDPLTLANKIDEPTHNETVAVNGDTKEQEQNLFNHLPQPTNQKKIIVEEDDEFLRKKEPVKDVIKPKSRITVPSLHDFKDVEDTPLPKQRTTNGKKSGLLSILPQPKNTLVKATTKSLVPNVIMHKPQTTVKKKEPLPSPLQTPKGKTNGLITEYSDESDDDLDNDFFSMNKPAELPSIDLPLDIDEAPSQQTTNEPKGIERYFKKDYQLPEEVAASSSNGPTEYYDNVETVENEYIPVASSSEAVLDEEAIRQLCGARGKRKREDIQIVDVNQQEVLAEARQLLMKGLMDDTPRHSVRKTGNEPTAQQRRKHHITYLAHQAKANEAELQNQWANTKVSRRQIRSKYGF